MKILLLKDARVKHQAGDIVEVSPADANFLVTLGLGEILSVRTEPEAPKRVTRKKNE